MKLHIASPRLTRNQSNSPMSLLCKSLVVCNLIIISFSSYAVEVERGTPKPVEVHWQKTMVEDEGLWPTPLLRGPHDALLTFSYNKPKHGKVIGGEVDAWISNDEGKNWTRGGSLAACPDTSTTRMNHAIGSIDNNTRLIAAVSGYREPSRPVPSNQLWEFILPVISESTDGGKTWRELGVLDAGLAPAEELIPFGTIFQMQDGSLRLTAYHRSLNAAYMLQSKNGGKTWSTLSKIGDRLSETAILPVSEKEWLALSRTTPEEKRTAGHIQQSRSLDGGATWTDEGPITEANEHPADLKRLQDGRLLLTYSIRSYGSIVARLSEDNGRSWSKPFEISLYKGDGGYPSSAQLSDGSILTTYYAKRSPALGEGLEKYHTGLVNWQLP